MTANHNSRTEAESRPTPQSSHVRWHILLLLGVIAAGFNLFATATWWAASNDMTRQHAGALSGLMNMSGNLGGWLCPIVTATIATRLGWERALDFAALVTLASGVFWIAIDAGSDLDGQTS